MRRHYRSPSETPPSVWELWKSRLASTLRPQTRRGQVCLAQHPHVRKRLLHFVHIYIGPILGLCCTSLWYADWHNLFSQNARLVRCFAAAVRADGVGVLLFSRDVGGLGCILCTVSLSRAERQGKVKYASPYLRSPSSD